MITIKDNGVRVLRPDEAPWLTNGEVFSQAVSLGRDAAPTEWREATQEEYESAMAEAAQNDEAQLQDYAAVLQRLGVEI